MAIVFPGFIFQQRQPIDPDWVNKATIDFYRELSTCLNEQNFSNLALGELISVDKTTLLHWETAREYTAISDPDIDLIETDNVFKIRTKNVWVDLDLEVSITTKGGLVNIFSSLNITSVNQFAGPAPFTFIGASNGIKFAIKIDGQLQIESLVGSGEPDQDICSNDAAVSTLPDPVDKLLLGLNSSGFIHHGRAALNIDYQAYLPAGQHIITVCAYLESNQDYLKDNYTVITNRELTAIEFTR